MDTREVVMPDTMPLERLEAEITDLAGHLAAGECRWLLLIAEYDRRAGWGSGGARARSSGSVGLGLAGVLLAKSSARRTRSPSCR